VGGAQWHTFCASTLMSSHCDICSWLSTEPGLQCGLLWVWALKCACPQSALWPSQASWLGHSPLITVLCHHPASKSTKDYFQLVECSGAGTEWNLRFPSCQQWPNRMIGKVSSTTLFEYVLKGEFDPTSCCFQMVVKLLEGLFLEIVLLF
jgi:hypothetical protein